MAILTSGKIEKDAVEMGASMMAVSARTAPKTRGIDSVKTIILTGEDLEKLAAAMEKKVKEKSTGLPGFKRDADNVRSSVAVLLIGVSRDPKRIELPLNCGACGYKNCKGLLAIGKREGEDFTGPVCIFQAIDLGIALGSAVKLAGELNIDNRIMYTLGAAAKKIESFGFRSYYRHPFVGDGEKSIFRSTLTEMGDKPSQAVEKVFFVVILGLFQQPVRVLRK